MDEACLWYFSALQSATTLMKKTITCDEEKKTSDEEKMNFF